MVCLLILAAAVHAESVVLSKPLNVTEPGWYSNINGTYQQAADDVLLGAGATVDRVSWYGFETNGAASSTFRIRAFLTAGSGEPMATPFYDEILGVVAGTDTGLTSGGYRVLEYESAIPDLALAAGTPYWLMIASADAAPWVWSHSDPSTADQWHRNGDADSWRSIAGLNYPESRLDQAFTLYAPEPGVLALLLIGLGAIGLRRRR